jgi:GAF domain-containing protein
VARAAREGQVITVENVRQDPSWLPNPLLPDTHSEMAVPVMLDKNVVGVLDIQSEQVGGLTGQDETIMLGLALQIAVAVRNARMFTETQNALNQAQRLQSVYTGQAWSKFSATRLNQFEIRHTEESAPLEKITTPEAVAALQQQQTIGLQLGNGAAVSAEEQVDAPANKAAKALATPLKLRDQIIGVLGIRDEANPHRRWSDDEIALIEAVSEQMSLAIENARLFEETGRRAGRERMIAEVTQQVWASAEIEEVMRTAVAQLGDKLQASEVVLRLGADEDLLAE